MKKAHYSFFILVISILFVNCGNQNQSATLSAEFENMGDDTIMIGIAPYNEQLTDQFTIINAKDGKFKFDTLIDRLYYGRIFSTKMFEKLPDNENFFIRSKIIDFFILPNEKIELTGSIDEFRTNYQIKGNTLNNQHLLYREIIIDDFEERIKLMFQIENFYAGSSEGLSIDTFENREREVYKSYREKTLKFIRENPTYEYSAYLLNIEQKENIIKLFPILSNEVKQSEYGKLINEKIKIWNQVMIGSLAPDFESSTFDNRIIRLSDYRGKYVVLDFWGSWCGPCKEEIPRLKEFYSKNTGKIEMIGIACRDTKENWEKAVKENDLNWTQILNVKGAEDLSKKFGIKGYPTKIIVNPDGIIEGIYLGITNDFYDKVNELQKE